MRMKIIPKLITMLCIGAFALGGAYVTGLLKIFGLHLGLVQYVSFILTICLVLSFLIHPIKKGMRKERLPWYDMLFIGMSLAGAGFPAIFIERWGEFLYTGRTTMVEVVLCFSLIIAVLESARRMIGLAMPAVASLFVIHLIFGHHFPSVFQTPYFSFQRITTLFYLSPDGIFGIALQVATTVVIVFMFFTAILRKSDAGNYITDTALLLSGRWRGGSAKAAVVASSLLGTITGDAVTNVTTTGSFTIPLMKKAGYKAEFAGAVEAVSSTGGQIMPPVMGMVAFIMAELLGISYWEVCVAAALPAILYYTAIFLQVDFEAAKKGLTGLPRERLPDFGKTVKGVAPYLLPIAVLVYLLAAVRFPPEYACLYALFVLLMVVLIIRQSRKETRQGTKQLLSWMTGWIEEGVKALLLPTSACAVAGIIIASVLSTGLGNTLSGALIGIAGNNVLLLLILTAVSSFILGMGMTSIPCYLILAVIVGPTLTNLGVLPIAAHLFFFYFGVLSFITPPVAVAAFVASGIAQSDPMLTGIWAVRLGIVAYIVPFIFIFNPALLLVGPISVIIIAMITSLIGVLFLASAMEGFLFKNLRWLERVTIGCAGILLIIPGWKTDIAGLILASPIVLWQLNSTKGIFHKAKWLNIKKGD